jgi:hypothetical protein
MDVFPFKTPLNKSMASPFNINGMIYLLINSFHLFFLCFYLRYIFCSPLDMDGHGNINLQKIPHLNKKSPMVNVLLLLHILIGTLCILN